MSRTCSCKQNPINHTIKDCPGKPPAAPKIRPLSELKPALPSLNSVKECPKCAKDFRSKCARQSLYVVALLDDPSLKFCEKADVVVAGVTFEGEHMHRTCPYCNYGWIEKTA